MSHVRGLSRSQSSVTSLSSHSDAPLTSTTAQSHSYRQLTLVPQMKSIKQRSSHDTHKTLPLKRSTSLAATHDNDTNNTTAPSSSQTRKQKTLDSFLVPATQPLTVEQRGQQRRERKERKQRATAANNNTHRPAAVTVDGEEEEEEDVRQRRMRRGAEVRERQRALKEERIDSEDEEDIPLFRIAPPTLPPLPAAPSTPSSSSQSQSSLPSTLSSLSSAIPSSASPVRRLKDELEDDEWDVIPSFVLQPQQNRLLPPVPPPQLRALPTPYQPPPLSPSSPPPATAAVSVAAFNPFAQSTSASLYGASGSIKGEWDDAPSVRLPLSQMLQSLSKAKTAANIPQRPSAAPAQVKKERTSPLSDKENIAPFITDAVTAGPTAKSTNVQRSSPPPPSSPPPLEPATQREAVVLQRHSSAASELSVDSISSVEGEAAEMRPSRVKRERVWQPLDDIEDEHVLQQHTRKTAAINRAALFPLRSHVLKPPSTSALPMSSAGRTAPSFVDLPQSARPLHQPQPLHPHSGISALLASPPPSSFPPPCPSPLPSFHIPQYAGPVESWPLAYPQPVDEEESKQPAGGVGSSGYSFRGISELGTQAAVNYGQIFQPKQKRRRRSSEQKEEEEGRRVKTDKKKKKKVASKRRKTEADADDEKDERGEKEAGQAKRARGQKKKRASGRWCTVNGVRTFIVGGKRLIGSAAYMAYKQESGGSISSKSGDSGSQKKKATKKTKRKSSGTKGRAQKERRRADGDDSGEEEWQPGDGEESGGGEVGSGDESAGSLADFIVADNYIESASSEGE